MKAQLGACQVYRFQLRTDLTQAQASDNWKSRLSHLRLHRLIFSGIQLGRFFYATFHSDIRVSITDSKGLVICEIAPMPSV